MQRIIVHIGDGLNPFLGIIPLASLGQCSNFHYSSVPVFLLDTLVRGIEGTKKVLNTIFDDYPLRLVLVVNLAIFVAK